MSADFGAIEGGPDAAQTAGQQEGHDNAVFGDGTDCQGLDVAGSAGDEGRAYTGLGVPAEPTERLLEAIHY